MACVTGKPISQGGVRYAEHVSIFVFYIRVSGRNEATGLGVFYGIREFLNFPEVQEKTGLRPDGLSDIRVIIQGFGNVGYWAARFFEQHGAKIIGVIEKDAAVYDENGSYLFYASKDYKHNRHQYSKII
jgi:glutamate dehydrogenase (NAD(P)+)